MKANLYINYYIDKDSDRHQEIVRCLLDNVKNKQIDNIIICVDKASVGNLTTVLLSNNLSELEIEKVSTEIRDGRPTYNDYFSLSGAFPDDINIIANTDITFEESGLERLKVWKWGNRCLALTRWDYFTPDMNQEIVKFYNRQDSQDVWMVQGRFKSIPEADFPLGKKGCDNRIAFLLSQKYAMLNASQTIRTFHLHLTNVRNYAPHGVEEDLIKPPYKLLPPMKLPIR